MSFVLSKKSKRLEGPCFVGNEFETLTDLDVVNGVRGGIVLDEREKGICDQKHTYRSPSISTSVRSR